MTFERKCESCGISIIKGKFCHECERLPKLHSNQSGTCGIKVTELIPQLCPNGHTLYFEDVHKPKKGCTCWKEDCEYYTKVVYQVTERRNGN